MNKQIFLSKHIFMIATLFFSILFFIGFIFADSNGVSHRAEDVQGGTFGADEMDVTSYFRFIHPVYFDENIEIRNTTLNVLGSILLNGTNVATLDPSGKVPISQLPFHKGDVISPLNRDLISGQTGYDTYYFDIANLGISGLSASNVKVGTQFGVNNGLSGTYTSDANATSGKLVQGNTAYVNGVKITGTLSVDSICSSAGGNATCGSTSSITPGDFYAIVGDNSPVGINYCTKFTINSDGSATSVNILEAAVCKLISSCTSVSQSIANYPDHTSCGTQLECISGSCVSMNFIFYDVIPSNTLNYNLKNNAINAGWNQIDPLVVTITINSNIIVGSNSVLTPAFDTGDSFPAGSSINIINNGYIVGKGGDGGNGAANNNPMGSYGMPGGKGGVALSISYPVSITNNGIIGGGGGGGGGAGSGGSGKYTYYTAGQGGSGGAGYYSGIGGSVGSGSGGTNGNSGTLTTGGAGVYGVSRGQAVYSGGGGNLGQSGTYGTAQITNYYPGTALPGAAGAAVVQNGNSVTWINYGDIRGAVS